MHLGIRGGSRIEDLFCQLVEIEVQKENIHARFTQNPQLAAGGVLFDELEHGIFAELARLGHAGGLKDGGVGGDVGVEAGAGRGDEIDGDGLARVLRGELVDGALNAVDQRL